MSETILEQNLEQLLKRCHRPVSRGQIDGSLARFERRLVDRPRHAGILAIAAAFLFAGLAAWIAMQGKAPNSSSNSSAARPSEAPRQDATPTPAPIPDKGSLDRARDLYLDGKFLEALVETNRVIELDPTSDAAFALRARLRIRRGDLRGAGDDADEALRLKPKSRDALLARAEVRLTRDDRDGAQRDATDALKLDMKYVDAFLVRARAKIRLKDSLGAQMDLRSALQLDSECGEAHLMSAAMMVENGKDPYPDYAAALKCGAWNDQSLASLAEEIVPVLKEGLAAAKSDYTARRIVSLLKTYKEGAEAIRAYEAKLAGRQKAAAEIDRLIADLAAADAPARKNAEDRLIGMGENVLEALGKARYHEIPEVRLRVVDVIRTITENRVTERALADIRERIKKVRARWTARDFTEIDQVLTTNFGDLASCTYVPVKRIGDEFSVGAAAEITTAIAEALDKNDTVFLSVREKGPVEIVQLSEWCLFTLPDKKGWSAYVIVRLKR